VARIGWLLFTGYQSFFSPDPKDRAAWKVWFYIMVFSMVLGGFASLLGKLSGDNSSDETAVSAGANSALSDEERESQEQP
jgi:hypothetical protein